MNEPRVEVGADCFVAIRGTVVGYDGESALVELWFDGQPLVMKSCPGGVGPWDGRARNVNLIAEPRSIPAAIEGRATPGSIEDFATAPAKRSWLARLAEYLGAAPRENRA